VPSARVPSARAGSVGDPTCASRPSVTGRRRSRRRNCSFANDPPTPVARDATYDSCAPRSSTGAANAARGQLPPSARAARLTAYARRQPDGSCRPHKRLEHNGEDYGAVLRPHFARGQDRFVVHAGHAATYNQSRPLAILRNTSSHPVILRSLTRPQHSVCAVAAGSRIVALPDQDSHAVEDLLRLAAPPRQPTTCRCWRCRTAWRQSCRRASPAPTRATSGMNGHAFHHQHCMMDVLFHSDAIHEALQSSAASIVRLSHVPRPRNICGTARGCVGRVHWKGTGTATVRQSERAE
jgi:hypothetical protein